MWHDLFICVPWLVDASGMPSRRVWSNGDKCSCQILFVTRSQVTSSRTGFDTNICWSLTATPCMAAHVWRDSETVWHDSFICATRLIHICAMTHWWVCHALWVARLVPLVRHDAFYKCDVTHISMWHDTFICVRWRIGVCDVPYGWHDSFISATWLILQIWHDSSYVCHDSLMHMACLQRHTWPNGDPFHDHICVAWLPHQGDMTHWSMWHDTIKCVALLIGVCDKPLRCMYDMNHSYMWHDPFLSVTWLIVTWLIHTWDRTHLYVWHYSFLRVASLIRQCDLMRDMTHSYVGHDSFVCVTWLIHLWHNSSICVTWLKCKRTWPNN